MLANVRYVVLSRQSVLTDLVLDQALGAEAEACVSALDDMIMEAHAEHTEQSGEGAGGNDVRLAWLDAAGRVAVMQDDEPARAGEQPGHEMGDIDRQAVMIADQRDPLDQIALGIIHIHGAKLATRVQGVIVSR